MKSLIAISLVGLSISLCAQSPSKPEVFTSSKLHDQLQQLAQNTKTTGGGGVTLGAYGTHTILVSQRTASGGGEIHAHFDDVMMVLEGNATLVTGGSVVDPHTGDNGETAGSGIKDGTEMRIGPGDLIHVPAGTPHQLLIAPGTTYSAIVVKVKE